MITEQPLHVSSLTIGVGNGKVLGTLAALAPWLDLSVLEIRGSCETAAVSWLTGHQSESRDLRSITLRNNHTVTGLVSSGSPSSSLHGVRELYLNNAPCIASLDPIGSQLSVAKDPTTGATRRHLTEGELQVLFVRCNRAMHELPLLMPSSLLSVTLKDTLLTSIDNLARCRLLTELDISSNRHLADLPGSLDFRTNMPNLRSLCASQTRIASIDALADCASIEVLRLDGAASLKRLAYMPCLRELYINYTTLADLSDIDDHRSLQVFEASWNKEVCFVPCLPRVRHLRLEGCTMLTELGMLHGNTSLERLHIDHCRQVVLLPSLPSLRVLSATCTGLTSAAIEATFTGHALIEEIWLRGSPSFLVTTNLPIRTD